MSSRAGNIVKMLAAPMSRRSRALARGASRGALRVDDSQDAGSGVATRLRLPVNLSLILDRSGSMDGDKLQFVKRAVAHTLRHLTPSDRVSIIAYDNEVDVVAPSFSVTPEATQAVLADVETIWAGGKTNLSLGWFTGCDQIADHIGSGVINRAMVLTDGLANEGLTDVEMLVNQARELRVRGITTSTFGVGYDFNQFLLQRIADAGGGHFYFIDDPEVIPAFFHGELDEMLSTVAKDIVLEVGVPKGASIEPLNGVPRELAENRRVRVLLGDAFSGQTREVVLRVELPAFQRNQHLLLPGRSPIRGHARGTSGHHRPARDSSSRPRTRVAAGPRRPTMPCCARRAAPKSTAPRWKRSSASTKAICPGPTTRCWRRRRRSSDCCHRERHGPSSRRSG